MYKTIIIALYILDYSDSLASKICKVPNADAGTCTVVSACDPLFRLYNNRSRSPTEDAFLRQSAGSCGSKGSRVKICCPPESQWSDVMASPVAFSQEPTATAPTIAVEAATETSTVGSSTVIPLPQTTAAEAPTTQTAPPPTDKWLETWINLKRNNICGLQYRSLEYRNNDYRMPDIDEYPWMALLEYDPREFKCGGSLISISFVLTAAHCLYSPPSKVRLSEYNITSEPYDVGFGTSGKARNATVVIMDVLRTITHPDHVYGTSVNDVGLIKTPNVRFTEFVRPICLPSMDYRLFFNRRNRLYTSGWGSDNRHVNSEVKKSIMLPHVGMRECYAKFPTQFQWSQHICAGGKEGVDSCRGDSGGPLMYEYEPSNFVIVGIVSSGAVKCGTKDHPGLYMHVYHYIEWITRHIYDNSIDSMITAQG